MTKTFKKFKVNVRAMVTFPIYVIAKDEDEAIEKCEESIGEGNFDTYNDSIGLNAPYDSMDDDCSTDVFEIGDYDNTIDYIEGYELNDDEDPEEIELEYEDDEDDEEE